VHHKSNTASAADCRDLGTLTKRQSQTEMTPQLICKCRGKPMSNDIKNSNERRWPSALETREQSRAKRERALSLEMELQKVDTSRSSDPYNTSGSFDRTKNWSRVGKR
jgi:hypothetical protein